MSLQQFLRILWVWRWTIIIATGACLMAGTFAAVLRPKTYTAESRVMLDVLKPDPITGDVISSSFARAYVPTQTELIRDYRVTGRVVDNLGWAKSPALREDYEASDKRGVDFRRWLAEQVSDAIKAYNIEGTNVLVIGYSADDPETAARMANTVRAAYSDEAVASRRAEASEDAGWYERQLAEVRNQLTVAEQRKTAFERANNIVLLDKDIDADAARLQALSGQVPPPASVVAGGGGNPAAGQLAAIDAKIAAAAASLGPNHPVLQELRQQRASVAAAGRAAGGSGPVIVGGGGGNVEAARARVLAQRDKVEEAKRLQADVTVLRDQYAKMAAKAADRRQQAASKESGITLLDSAVPPRSSDPPSTFVIIAGALGLGLGMGVMISLLIELLYRRVRGPEDLRALKVPLLGAIVSAA